MNILVFFKKVFDRVYVHTWDYRKYSTNYYCKKTKNCVNKKNIWLLGIPRSSNLGDHAQVMCSEKWFKINYPDYKVHEFDSFQLMNHGAKLIRTIAEVIKEDDIVFFQSGYNTTDLYPNQEKMHREVIKRIHNNKIVYLPQTMSFKEPINENEFVKESRDVYKGNNNLYILCRDNKSFEIAKEAFPGIRKRACPDIVTTLIGSVPNSNAKRDGIVLCVRHDKESVFSGEQLSKLRNKLSVLGTVLITDTTINFPSQVFIRRNREKYIFKQINLFQSKKVVVTDRYHGLVFSLIANTPVVLLKTRDHKITEGVKWFPDEITRHIRIANSTDEAVSLARELIFDDSFTLGADFYQKYYLPLKQLIESDEQWDIS